MFTVIPLTVSSSPAKDIIIIDDEESYLDLMSQRLTENLSNRVYAFSRPLAALEALPALNPGMVITDYYMPQINGLEFIVRARTVLPNLPFIVITGHGVHLSRDEFSHLPELKTVLHKPFSWQTLAAEIVRHWPDENTPALKAEASSS